MRSDLEACLAERRPPSHLAATLALDPDLGARAWKRLAPLAIITAARGWLDATRTSTIHRETVPVARFRHAGSSWTGGAAAQIGIYPSRIVRSSEPVVAFANRFTKVTMAMSWRHVMERRWAARAALSTS